jgi:hypothetical protein
VAEITLRGQTLTVEQKLVTEECYSCHVLFAMTADFKQERLKDKRDFYCPNGHAQCYVGKTEAQKLKEQLEAERRERQRAEQRVAQWQDEAREAKERAERERNRANGYKGHATRMTKRVKAGVCPCCNRTFKQLAAHMANKHPEFTPIEIPEGAPCH